MELPYFGRTTSALVAKFATDRHDREILVRSGFGREFLVRSGSVATVWTCLNLA